MDYIDQPISGPKGKFHGPEDKRHCRDLLFLILLVCCWGALGFVAATALEKGNPELLVVPMDYQGNLCGRDNSGGRKWMADKALGKDFTNAKFLYFLNPFNLTLSKCVESCPTETSFTPFCAFPSAGNIPGTSGIVNTTGCMCTYEGSAEPPQTCYNRYESAPVGGRCFPGNATMISKELKSEIGRFNDWASKFTANETKGWRWLLAAAGIAFGMAFIWMVLLRFLGGVMVWMSILLSWCACAALSAWLFIYGRNRKQDADPNDKDAQRNADAIVYTSYAVIGITFIILCMILFMFKRIMIAIGCVKQAARAIGSMPFIFAVPIVCFVVICGFFVFFVYIAVYLVSSGDIKVEGCCRKFVFDRDLTRAIWFHIFGVVWSILFVIGCGALIVNVAVAHHYFSTSKSKTSMPVTHATTVVFANHLGSIAFGTLLIAIVAVIRMWFVMVQRQMKALKENSTVKVVLCCVNCCLACFQRFLEFITIHAFVQIAITGDNFCKSARNAFSIMAENPIRMIAVSGVSAFVIILGKIFITIATLLSMMALLNKFTNPVLDSYLMYTLICFIAYAIADAFLEVFESAVRTVLQCFIMDEKFNAPDYYAHDDLKRYMGKVSEKKPKGGNTHQPLQEEDQHKV